MSNYTFLLGAIATMWLAGCGSSSTPSSAGDGGGRETGSEAGAGCASAVDCPHGYVCLAQGGPCNVSPCPPPTPNSCVPYPPCDGGLACPCACSGPLMGAICNVDADAGFVSCGSGG